MIRIFFMCYVGLLSISLTVLIIFFIDASIAGTWSVKTYRPYGFVSKTLIWSFIVEYKRLRILFRTTAFGAKRFAITTLKVVVWSFRAYRRTINNLVFTKECFSFRKGKFARTMRRRRGSMWQSYTASRARPIALRRLTAFRPPGVCFRTRKPWVVFRLRFFGLYVTDIRESIEHRHE